MATTVACIAACRGCASRVEAESEGLLRCTLAEFDWKESEPGRWWCYACRVSGKLPRARRESIPA